MAFDGAIDAYIGADTKSYEQAMNEIAASTQKAFQKAQDSAVNSSNRLVQMVGQVMAQLASNGQSLGQRLGNAYSTGLNLSLGEIQRIASRIGEKIPEPIRSSFRNVAKDIVYPFKISAMQIKNNLQSAFNFDISKAIKTPSGLLNQLVHLVNNVTDKVTTKLYNIGSVFNNTAGNMTSHAKVFEVIGSGANSLAKKLRNLRTEMVESLGKSALSVSGKSWTQIFLDIAKAATAPNAPIKALKGVVDGTAAGVRATLGNLGFAFEGLANKLPQPFDRAARSVKELFRATFADLLNPLRTSLSGVGNLLTDFSGRFTFVSKQISNTLGEKATSPILQSWTALFSKLNAKADSFNNSFTGKLTNTVGKLSTKVSQGLGAGFQTMGNKAVSALTGIVSHTNRAASASTNLIQQVAGISLAYAAFNGIKTAIGDAITKSADFEAKLSSIKAVTGSSAETMAQFKDAAIKAGAETAFSASEAADAIEELSKAGVSTKDILAGGLTGALNLATAGELDLKSAAEIASTALNAFKNDNLTVVDAANQLAGAANASATDVGELKYGLSMVSAVASGLGLSFNDTTNALAVFAQNGLKGSDAGTSLKTMLMNLQPQTKKARNLMSDLGLITADGANQFFTAEGKIKSFAEISELLNTKLGHLTDQEKQLALKTMFGTDAVRAATIAMNEGADGANKMQAEISKVTAADVAAEKLNNFKGAIEGLSGSFETLQIKVGSAVLPIFTVLVKALDRFVDKLSQSQAIDNFVNMMSKIPPVLDHFLNGTKVSSQQLDAFKASVSNVAPAIALLVGSLAFGPAVAGLQMLTAGLGGVAVGALKFGGLFSGVISSASSVIGFLAGKMTGLPATFGNAASKGLSVLAMMTQGMSSVVSIALASVGPAAILGMVLVGLGLVYHMFGDKIDEVLTMVQTKGPEVIQRFVAGITSEIPQLITLGSELIAKLAQTFAVMFPVIVQAGVDIIGSLVSGVGQNTGSLINSALTVFTSFVTAIISALPQLLIIGLDFLNNLVLGIIQNIPQIQESATQIITQFTNGIQNDLPTIITKGAEILTNLVNGAIQLLPVVISLAGTVITTLISGLVQSLPTLLGTGVTLIVTFVSGLIQNLPMIVQTAMDLVQSLIGGIIQALPQLIAAGIQLIAQLVVTLIMGLPQIIEAGVKLILGLGQAMLEAIPNALSGVWEGIKTGFSSVWDFLTGKSSETTEKVSTDAQTMTTNVATQTSQMSTNTNVDMTAMLNSINQNMGLANIQATNQATQMASGVNGQTGTMSSQAILDSIALANGVTSNLNTANVSATSEAQTMADGVNQAASSMNLSAVNEALGLSAGVTSNLQTAQANANNAASTMNATVTSNMASMQSNASSATSGLASNVTAGLNQASSSANASSAQMANNVTTNFNKAKSSVDNSMKGINQTVTASFNKLNADIQSFGNKFNQAFTNSFRKASDVARNGMNTVQNAVSNGMNQALIVARNAGNQMINVMQSISGGMNSAGYYAGIGFANGLASSAGSIYAIANSIANNVVNTIRRALDIHSPSRATFALGGFTGEGFVNGMADWLGEIDNMGQQYAQAVTDQKYGLESHITSTGSISSNGISNSLESLSSDILESQLSEPVFEIHNELVGDEIYTSVKEKESREYQKNEYFIYE